MNKLTELRARAQTLFFPPQRQRDEGAGIVEYAAILILVAAIAVALFAIGLPDSISNGIRGAVDSVLLGPGDAGAPDTGPTDD